MRLSDLYPGMQVRVIYWAGDMPEDADPYDYRPEHWCEGGGMDDWQGEIVTIAECNPNSGYIYIKEDDHEWRWHPLDFEYYCSLPHHNPNKVYKRQSRVRLTKEVINEKLSTPPQLSKLELNELIDGLSVKGNKLCLKKLKVL